ncbi:hypothetical protein [Salinigranum sp. GCM10025319]|uniref:hypothetical protein n=1 Tax=Salinigranum sp. GCM10025319 TaxID=3252687 RepID=UPI00360C63F7
MNVRLPRGLFGGATIHFQSCTIARGEAGKRFLREVGRIFFGEEKRGYLKGNTEEAPAMIGVGPAAPPDPPVAAGLLRPGGRSRR